MKKYILGIESSCDDTAVAVVDAEGQVLSSVIKSQIEIHSEWGGVFPEYASRAHVVNILPAVQEALALANIDKDDIEAIGVTRGPGLIGSLLVGLNTASGLGAGWQIPVIGINHLRGHLRSADLEEQRVKYPATVLLVSGGHTLIAHMKSPEDIELLGSTRDDSVGEAYDKVGRMLGLGFPGGPYVDKLAKTGEVSITFPRPMVHKGLEFSFSGLKSAVSRYLANTATPEPKANIAASFVEAAIDLLITKCRRALKQHSSNSLVIVGGVAASPQLRAAATALCEEQRVKLCLPPIKWSTDNAAMIGFATWDYIKKDIRPIPQPQLNLSIADF